MLILKRFSGDSILIFPPGVDHDQAVAEGDFIEVKILHTHADGQITVGVQAPREYNIIRRELLWRDEQRGVAKK